VFLCHVDKSEDGVAFWQRRPSRRRFRQGCQELLDVLLSNAQDVLIVQGPGFEDSGQGFVGFNVLLSGDIPLIISHEEEEPKPIGITPDNTRTI